MTFERPKTPQYLVDSTYRLLGSRCLRCDVDRPLEVAHIMDWPKCVAVAGEGFAAAPDGWHYAEALRHFHHVGNMLPLCANCHALYDGSRYADVTECEIRSYRDTAVRRPEILSRLIDFVGTELSGRPNRCAHRVSGKRMHSRAADVGACTWPLIWISKGYELGLIDDNPKMLVVTNGDVFHDHVCLRTTAVSSCSGDLSECRQGSRIWRHASRSA
ncbi:HNH endonuclease [Streptomyces sp. NPDC050988]|uniref:HNH endonuclease n=1 Tax=Streptomyces sp. NPDC050988 TaxID=3365637 RepID=UPI00378A816B